MGTEELDARICTLPPAYGLKHFKNGLSPLSQISGGERKDMAKILLGCLVGKLPKQAIIAIRSLLDFIYIAQYPTHSDTTLGYLSDALKTFHQNKAIFVTLGVRENFNIPKFHSLLHYVDFIRWFGATNNYNTEMFEHFHIDMAKDAWRASNHRNECPQMTTWLTRQEKTVWFECYQFSLQNRSVLRQQDTLQNSSGLGINIAKVSPLPQQPLQSIQQNHQCHGFIRDIKEFLNRLIHVNIANVPFDSLDVFTSFKLTPIHLGDNASASTHVGRVKVIFKLPAIFHGGFVGIPKHWPKIPLAYIEWYTKLKGSADPAHMMYAITKPALGADGTPPASIVP
ncbi:hypothetical protein SERLADRAFT_368127 [Serpula lacrymans var. lacrymans S7.9]|uniref:Uncharacterized protein n=1 Tax=Serpula lacrymans var. lacrymans (strain S7.9) TaxID=578457 RepID=F8NQB2_SERL9|nr:uncharacterized protein SERLADRAFT_368127 [Serpula lacrymans var. lacrymans S7.9]EGO26572.1 hypothetical protein SERLADRAFT_368127 [Serpula lacrymans var. lacrymans S7.9]